MTCKNKKVFIVDDDESVCRALKILLSTYGFTVNTFSSAEEFFSAIPNSVSGCLILDIYMSGLDGWEAQQRLLKSGSQRRVIMITASENRELEELALKAGAAGFLRKPFNDQALVDLVDSAFESKIEVKESGNLKAEHSKVS